MFDEEHISVDGPRGYTWAQWSEIVDLLSQIDYDCQFDCDGSCKTTRKEARIAEYYGRDDLSTPKTRGCCEGCADMRGWGVIMPPEALEEVEALFDNEDGFWTPSGCRLPPEYKSTTCWTHLCNFDNYNNATNKKVWRKVYRLVRGANWRLPDDSPIPTVEEVRVKLAAKGMLRESQLVTIS